MPFKSEAQRRYLFARHPEVAEEFAAATPKGKKLPEKLHPEKTVKKVKKAYALGLLDAWSRFGLADKVAGAEIRMKIPQPSTSVFHGFDQAWRDVSARGQKRADALDAPLETPDTPGNPVERLTQALQALNDPPGTNTTSATRDKMDRETAWGAPSNLAAGDTGSRQVGGMGPVGGLPAF